MARPARHLRSSRGLTRRLFVEGALRTTLLAGLGGGSSIAALASALPSGGPKPGARRGFDGEIIAEPYSIAHRLRDGTLNIPDPAPEGPLLDAIVIGGGVSGLMAAWELERGGLADVALFEMADYVGGNARKGHANGTDFTCATWSLARPRDPFLTRLLQDLDVIERIGCDGTPRIRRQYVGPGPEYNIFLDGAWYAQPDFASSDDAAAKRLPLSQRGREGLAAFYREMRDGLGRRGRDGRPAFAMPVKEGSRDADLLALDRITLEEFVRRKGWGDEALAEADDWSTSTIGGSVREVSAYAFWAFNCLGQGGEDITLPGGNAWLAAKLAEKVGREKIASGRMAVRVRNQGREVHVTLIDPASGSFSRRRARAVVIACPKHITGRIVPEMSRGAWQAYRQFRYGALLMGAAHVRRTPVLKGGPLAWFNAATGRFIQGFLVADYNSPRWRQGDPARPNVLCLWAPLAGRATRSELLLRPWTHWADRMAADLEDLVPGILDTVTRLDIYAWGHHMVIPYPGFLTGTALPAVSRPLGRITFAHSDRNGMPSFELATRAGHDAAREAIALVRGETS